MIESDSFGLGDFELRDYPPLVVAEITTAGGRQQGLSSGFGPLARYIFAKERGGERIAMTAPVQQRAVHLQPFADRGQRFAVADVAALDEVVRGMPGGIHASLGKQSDQLSGGQLQRLGLARALYPKPRLIILDEATSALDAGSEAAVSKNIRALGDSVTLVGIAHRLSTIQHADAVYVVDDGKIIASGPFKTLRKTVPLIEEYVKLMSFDDTE